MASNALAKTVVSNILAWLPVKSVIRFKCVCKLWFSLIESSSFVSMHLNHTTLNNENGCNVIKCRNEMKDKDDFLLLSHKTFEVSVNLDMPIVYDDLKIELEMMSSCNGIICLHDKRYGDLIILWNPATKEANALSKSSVPTALGLRYNSSNVGFGFDVNSNTYKVVRIICYTDDGGQHRTHQVEVYSLITGSWRLINVVMPVSNIMPSQQHRAYLNGIYYWWARNNTKDEMLLSFDMSSEVFGTTLLPADCALSTYANYRKSLAVLNESIALILFSWKEVTCFEIWVRNEYSVDEPWNKLYITETISGCPWPLGFSKCGELFLGIRKQVTLIENGDFFLQNYDQLVLLNCITHELKDLQVEGEPGSIEVLVYKESLVSVKEANDQQK